MGDRRSGRIHQGVVLVFGLLVRFNKRLDYPNFFNEKSPKNSNLLHSLGSFPEVH